MAILHLLYRVFYTKRVMLKSVFTIIGLPTYYEIIMLLFYSLSKDDAKLYRDPFPYYIAKENLLYIFDIVAREIETDNIIKLNFSYRYRYDIKDLRKRSHDFGNFSLKKFYQQNPNFDLQSERQFKIIFISVKALPLAPTPTTLIVVSKLHMLRIQQIE